MSVEFTFDDRPLTARPGQTVGAALLANGVRSWRTTRFGGRPRGLFCGIGVCFDCLVTVNGEPNVRACLAPVGDGDVVSSQIGDGHAALAASTTDLGAEGTASAAVHAARRSAAVHSAEDSAAAPERSADIAGQSAASATDRPAERTGSAAAHGAEDSVAVADRNAVSAAEREAERMSSQAEYDADSDAETVVPSDGRGDERD